MSLFVLDTGGVSASLSSIDALSSQIENVANNVEGFDTNCEGESFNFSGAKSAIVGNINACATKVSNTARVIENVINSHTALQGSLKFESSAEKAAKTSAGSSSNVVRSSASSVQYSSGSRNYSSFSGGTSVGGGVVGVSSVMSNACIPTTGYSTDSNSMVIAKRYGLSFLPTGAYETSDGLVIPGSSTVLQSKILYPNEVVGLPAKGVMAVDASPNEKKEIWYYGYSDKSKNKHLFTGISEIDFEKTISDTVHESLASKIKYNEEGYATVDGRYVISCDSYFGEVGDKVQVFTSDGVIECIIGDTSAEVDNSLTFFTNEACDGSAIKNRVTVSNIKSINNIDKAGAASSNTISNAVNTATTVSTSVGTTVDISKYSNNPSRGFTVTTGNTTFNLSDSEKDLLYSVVSAESDNSYDDALAVTSVILNRCEDPACVSSFGSSPGDQVSAPNQFSVYSSGSYKKYSNGNAPATVKQAVDDALAGVRNCDYLSFRSNSSTGYSSNMISSTGNRYK